VKTKNVARVHCVFVDSNLQITKNKTYVAQNAVQHVHQNSFYTASAETLQHKEAGCCELEDGASIAAETARRLACDCSVVRIVEDEDGNPLDVGRKTRSIPPALQRALNSRDKGCDRHGRRKWWKCRSNFQPVFPAAVTAMDGGNGRNAGAISIHNTKWTDGHHIKHWANGGDTKLKNLVTLCRFHHRLVHEGGWNVQALDDGALRFLKPNGEVLEDKIPLLSCQSPLTIDRPEFAEGQSRAPAQWNGDSMDYHLAVQVLCQKEARAKNVGIGRFR